MMGVFGDSGRVWWRHAVRTKVAWVMTVMCASVAMAAPPALAQNPFTLGGGSPFGTAPSPYVVAFNPAGTLLAVSNVPLNVNEHSQFSISMFTVNADGSLQAVDGSPFPVDEAMSSIAFDPSGTLLAATHGANSFSIYSVSPTGALSLLSTRSTVNPVTLPLSVAFSPSGLMAIAYTGANTVATYTVYASGSVTQVATASTGESSNPQTVAFNPAGNLIATANVGTNSVSVFSVASSGALSPVGDFSTGDGLAPVSAAFSPTGQWLATANQETEDVTMFSVAANGTLSQAGFPTDASTGVRAVAFQPSGLLAVASSGANVVELFSVDAYGGLTYVQGIDSFGVTSVAFGRSGGLLAMAETTVKAAVVYKVGPPKVEFIVPSSDGTVGPGTEEFPQLTNFRCSAAPYAPGISSCVDQNGNPSGGDLDTSPGSHTFTVTATSIDGQITTKSIIYTVIPGPTATISSPASGGTYAVGQSVPTSFSCDAAPGGPTLELCLSDAWHYAEGVHFSGTGALDTSTAGVHTYSVRACAGIRCAGGIGSASITYTVEAVAAGTTLSNPVMPSAGVTGSPVTVTTKLSRADGETSCVAGQPVLFTWALPDASIVTQTATTAADGTASVSLTPLTRGVHAVSASFAGGTCLQASASSAAPVAVYQPMKLLLERISGAVCGAPIELSASLLGPAADGGVIVAPAGQTLTITFSGPDAPPLQLVQTDANGKASLHITCDTPGTITAEASFFNAADFFTNRDGSLPPKVETSSTSFVLTAADTELRISPPAAGLFPDPISVSAVLSRVPEPSGPIAAAAVDFEVSGPAGSFTVGATTNASGTATTSFVPPARGTYTVTARFAGGGPVLASTAAPAHVSAYQKTALYLGPITASAGATTTVTASLLTENITVLPDGQIISVGGFDRPLPGQVVTFDFGGAAPPQSAVTDACGLATVSVVFPSPATVTATASFLNAADFYTNSTGAVPSAVETAAAPVTVADATPPTIEAHPGISVPATSGAGATVTYTSPASHDAVSGDGTAVCLPASGSTFVPGPTTVNCTATDAAGNHSSSSFVVTVTNNVPTFTPPANITAPSTFAAGAVVTFVATGSDVEDGPIPAACIPASGAVFPRGVTTVGCTVTDASGAAATASFTVTVLNAVPVAVNDAYTGQWNTPLTVAPNGVLANDTDANNDPLTSILGAGPSHGVLALNANGEFTYTPAAGYYGTDSFTYRADDGLGGMTALATVRLTITTPCPARHGHDRDDHRWWDRDDDRDDGKCGRGTAIAQDDVFSAHENTPLSVAAGNGVLDNDGRYAATALGVTTPAHGTVTLNANGSLVYMPAAGFFGIDSFLYAARNNAGITGPAARVRIIVRRNIAPDADNDYYSTKKKETLTVKPNGGVLDNDSDPNRDPIAAVLVSGPSHGTLMLNANGSFVYKPAATFTGTDAFTYKAADPAGLTDTATVTIRVGVSRGRDDDDRPSKHYRGDRSDHELGRGGHFDGDDCEYDRMFRR